MSPEVIWREHEVPPFLGWTDLVVTDGTHYVQASFATDLLESLGEEYRQATERMMVSRFRREFS